MSVPQLAIEAGEEIIEISTGQEGEGRINISPESRKITSAIITGNVAILYRDINTGAVTMEGNCKKLTYLDEEKTLIMEGEPEIKRGRSFFSGDTIYYNLEDNTLEIRGNVNAKIHTEEPAGD